MCGICGIVGKNQHLPESERIVRDMMECMAHRGPDADGIVSGDAFVFGHKRLSIIDLEFGRQPMQSADQNVTLVYNGEIYNYLELRQDLSRAGQPFKTFSDTETLLKLYETERENCLKRLNGMFAFAFFSQREQRFFAARDHFGIKPFYYAILPDETLVFASEIKALLRHPGIKACVNMEGLQEYLTFQFCLGSKTMFQGIHKLEPGQMLTWDFASGRAAQVATYWQQNYDIDTDHTEEFFLNKLLILLEDSVRQQLRSDVPLGAYLSGGIDSAVVATLAGMQYGKGFQCFHGRFLEGPAYDESSYARIASESISAELHTVTPTADDFVHLLPKLIYHLDEPVAGPGLFPQYLVSQKASECVKVVLGGQGGDEVFGGYARYLIAYLEQCLKGAIFQTQEEGKHIVTLDSIIRSLPLLHEYVPLLKDFWKDGLFDDMALRYFRLIDRSHDLQTFLSDELNGGFAKEHLFEKFSSVFNQNGTKSYVNKMLNFDQKTLLPALLQIEDRVSMAVSLESRVPLLDYRIVELANSMPPALKFKDGKIKNALREAMKSLLPAEITRRSDKMGFPVPLREWMKQGVVHDFVLDTIQSRALRERGLFNVGAIQKLLEKEEKFGRQLWGILCLELWYQTFIDSGN